MKRTNLKKLLAAALVLAQVLCLGAMFAIGASAAATDGRSQRSYTFYKADASMLDGTYIKDDAWANIPESEDFNLYSYSGTIVDTFGANFKAVWSKDNTGAYLYFRIVIKDNTANAAALTNWTRDGFVVAVKEDGNKTGVSSYNNSTSCRKTATQNSPACYAIDTETGVSTITMTYSDYAWYTGTWDGTTVIIDFKYQFKDASYAIDNAEILFDVMAQNNLGGDGKYQQTAWNSVNGKAYSAKVDNVEKSTYLGTGILSGVSASTAIPVNYKGNTNESKTIALVSDAASAATVKKIQDETLTKDSNNRVSKASYTDKYIVKTAADESSVTYSDIGLSMAEGAAVRLSSTPTGLRFQSYINKAAYDALIDAGKTVTVGTLILPTDLLGENAFTKEALDAAGVTYLDVVNNGWNEKSTEDVYSFYGSIVNLKAGNYGRNFSAIAYITIGEGEDAITVYSAYDAAKNSRNVTAVAQAALEAGGYNDAEVAILNGFIPAV